jgi:RimJ/RimL family protein N-acetyltransferase
MLPQRVREEGGRGFVQRVLREQRGDRSRAWAILPVGRPDVIGQIRLIDIDLSYRHRSAEVGYWIRRSEWGRGFGTEALRLVVRFAFSTLRLHRLQATVAAGNARSARVLEKVGFRREGVARHAHRRAGRWRDDWLFGLLRSEFLS